MLSDVSTMNTYQDSIDAAKVQIDKYIQSELGQTNSEISTAWIYSEFEKQKDFCREGGLRFSDKDVLNIVVLIGKNAVKLQYEDALKYKRELDITRPTDYNDTFVPPFADTIPRQGIGIQSKKKHTSLNLIDRSTNVDTFQSGGGAKAFI